MINKLTGRLVSSETLQVMEKLKRKESVSINEIKELPEIKEAYSCICYATPTIQIENRENIRKSVFEKLQKMGSAVIDQQGNTVYNGYIKKERRIDIIIGLPASGKSSTLVNPISQFYNSRIIDSDEAKKLLPEYNKGWGAGIVHEESKMIISNQIVQSMQNGENIVLPIVGSDINELQKKINFYKESEYVVFVHYCDISKHRALERVINRFLSDGRFLDPELYEKYGNKVEENYEILKGGNVIDGYSKWNNEEEQKCIEQSEGCLSRALSGNIRNGGRERANDNRKVNSSEKESGKVQREHVEESGRFQQKYGNIVSKEKSVQSDFSFYVDKKINHKKIINKHKNILEKRTQNTDHLTVVINAFGGPGAGKSTASLGICEELKKLGYMAEYVPEYSKELVWDENWKMLDGTEDHQLEILEEQIKRMDRLVGKVDFIVTDAPILLNQIYNKELTPEYESMLQHLYNQYNNFNFVVQRDSKEFETEGRIHDLQESLQKDREIFKMLDKYGLYYGKYNHQSVDKVIKNAVRTHERCMSHNYASPYMGIVYEENGKKSILYGEHPEHIIGELQMQQHNNRIGTVYIGKLLEETQKYGDYCCYDIKTGRDISPIYLTIPHIANRNEFRKLIGELKKEGAKYNTKKRRWYITRETNTKPFEAYLTKPSVLQKIKQNKKDCSNSTDESIGKALENKKIEKGMER